MMGRRAVLAMVVALAATAGATYLTLTLAAGDRGYALLLVLACTWIAAGWSLAEGVPPAAATAEVDVTDGVPRNASRTLSWVGGVLVLVALVLGVWAILTRFREWPTLVPIWLGCCLLVIIGSILIGSLGSRAVPERLVSRRARLVHGLLFAACLLIGVAFRLYRLDSVPPGVWLDETNIALDALHILDGRPDSPFWVGWWETPSLYAYYMAGIFKIGGVTFWSLKTVSLIPAVLTVAAIYPVGQMLFGAPVAVLATFFLAVSGWHNTMSRWGFNELMPPFFQLSATALLLHAFSTRRAVHFALAGLTLGLGMYTYLSSRLVVGVIAAYVLYRILFERKFLRRHVVGLVLFGLSYLLCFGPLVMTYAESSFAFLNRSRQLSIVNDVEKAGSWAPVYENAGRHLLMFHGRGDSNPRHNLPGRPMLSLVPGVLVLLGIGLALRRVTDHRFALLFFWVTITLLGGILSTLAEGPQAYRTLGVEPALCLLCAVVAAAWVRTVGRNRLLRPVAFALLLGALAYSAYDTYQRYFIKQAHSESVAVSFSPTENDVAHRLVAERAAVGGLSHVYLSARYYFFAPVRYFLYQPRKDGHGGADDPEFHIIEPQADLPLAAEVSRDVLLILEPDVAQGLDALRSYYPHVTSRLFSDQGLLMYAEVAIPREDIVALQGLNGIAANGKPLPAPSEGQMTLPRQLAALSPGSALVGALQAPRTGLYSFQVDGPLALYIDAAAVHHTIFLGQGLHDIRVARTKGSAQPELLMGLPRQSLEPLEMRQLFRLSAPRQGLRGRYYTGTEWSGEPIFERIDPVLSFSWPEEEPVFGAFSARWEGQLKVADSGAYFFEANCDDGCALRLDGEELAAGLSMGNNVIRGLRHLDAGSHAIRLDYFQLGGGKGMKLSWRPPGKELGLIPSESLTPAPVSLPVADQPIPDTK